MMEFNETNKTRSIGITNLKDTRIRNSNTIPK